MNLWMEPRDEYNERLVSHVHPSDWSNPAPKANYDLVVIGAGTAGLVTAAGAAGLGARVALVERHLMGGDCLNVGCVPSKSVISAARRAAAVRDAAEFGVESPAGARTDFGAAMARMRRLRASIAPHDSAARFAGLGVDVFLGEARFVDGSTVGVGEAKLRFAKAALCTGARAAAPPISGLAEVDALTNETIFSLTELPRRIGIIGAGPIGCEMAQSFARFGADVLLVEAAHGILPREDPEAAGRVLKSMQRDGVRLLCCGKDLTLARADGGGVRMRVASHGQGYDEEVDRLLVAVGRAPNVEGLGLEKVGVEYTAKGVKVNDRLQTTHPRIYAAGDICSPYQFTHAADFMARIVIQNALFFGRAKASALTIPWCTYTEPELARVGLNAADAKARGVEIDTFTQELADVDRCILEGETNGMVQVHVARGGDRIVGATIVGTTAGDLIAEITLAMTHGLGLKKIASTIHPYPTRAEALRRVGDQYNRTRLTPRARRFLAALLSLQR